MFKFKFKFKFNYFAINTVSYEMVLRAELHFAERIFKH